MTALRPCLGLVSASLLATSLLGAAGCGAVDSSAKNEDVSSEIAPVEGELFLRNSDGVLDLVRVDLATGARGRIGDVLPVEVGAKAFVMFSMSSDGSRVVVDVPSHDNLQTIFVLDRAADGSAHWRKLAEDAAFMQASDDASIVSYTTGSQGNYVLHLVRYDGETVADVTAPAPADLNVYPQLAAMSPRGRWAVVRRSLHDLVAYAIPEHGPASGPSFPSVQGELVPLCALPSTFLVTANDRTTGRDTYWFEPTFTSIDVAGFLGKRSTVSRRVNTNECAFQVDGEGEGIRTVSVIEDESLASGFSFDGSLGDLLDANDDHWLVGDRRYTSASLTLGSRKTGATVATYDPLPTVRPVPAGHEAQRAIEVLAHSLGPDRQAVVVRVRTDVANPATPAEHAAPLEESNELWVVEGGKAMPTVRLAEGPWGEAGWPAIPRNYSFSKNGKHLYWTNSDSAGKLRVHVRDLPNGDGERVLDGTLFTATRPLH